MSDRIEETKQRMKWLSEADQKEIDYFSALLDKLKIAEEALETVVEISMRGGGDYEVVAREALAKIRGGRDE